MQQPEISNVRNCSVATALPPTREERIAGTFLRTDDSCVSAGRETLGRDGLNPNIPDT